MTPDEITRQQLVNMLTERQAHMDLEDAVANFPEAHINTRPPNLDYSFWHLLEHIRIAQVDILDYIRNPDYVAPKFPEGYWPVQSSETDLIGWNNTLSQFFADHQALVQIIQDPATDLYAPIPHGWNGHNIVREINIVATHNAYHIGEFGILRQIMGLW